mmetsp:Transcript_3704/g.6050  ORF Transcript_3704/g.6050 Transcript_3704/m.6050 type:complete len:99 (-) Transcript_3704:20-316(-)|eukprot:CAMPEP_0205910790 /NCGR_PEP_ID=MMETSP1325-20131115/4696_1 /ASSEMBLY_ACC=CAM_ASM_000708 /TAXON_ID=236786 /ORGANISM="Florenciella sp., Strain RCC1007" /LENGTH=98 /DNA_ID=CAMNT_0053277201 /DNA_START=125 /DNA_END=421 /DNA_ORIENTATION=+
MLSIKKIAGVILVFLSRAARKIIDPKEGQNEHRERINTDPFYDKWLIPKMDAFYEKKGWPKVHIPGSTATGGATAEGQRAPERGWTRSGGATAPLEAT